MCPVTLSAALEHCTGQQHRAIRIARAFSRFALLQDYYRRYPLILTTLYLFRLLQSFRLRSETAQVVRKSRGHRKLELQRQLSSGPGGVPRRAVCQRWTRLDLSQSCGASDTKRGTACVDHKGET